MIVVSDSTPLMHFAKVGKLELIKSAECNWFHLNLCSLYIGYKNSLAIIHIQRYCMCFHNIQNFVALKTLKVRLKTVQ